MDLQREKRLSFIIARGEMSNHAHILTGKDADLAVITREGEDTFIEIPENAEVLVRHLLEDAWMEGREISVIEKEQGRDGHADITLHPGKFKYIPQIEKDPFTEVIRQVMD